MATTLAPQSADSVLPAPVRHPLARLRRTIQYYVLAEGLLLLGVVLASLWWVGLVVDYGLFVLTGSESWRYLFGSVGIRTGVLDWVQVLPMWLRVGLLGLVVLVALTVVIRYVVLRLVREFSVTSLALLLEQKFPALLGDRLITAVELADQRKAAEQGYSWAMVEKTIAEAEQAVSQVPIGSIFNWGRLRRLGAILLGLTLGLVGLVGVGGVVAGASARTLAYRGWHIAAIYTERAVLLRNSAWPRDYFVEIVEPTADPVYVGNDTATSIAVRALPSKYVIADPESPVGYRPARWSDLPKLPWLGVSVPAWPSELGPAPEESTLDNVQAQIFRETDPYPQWVRDRFAPLFDRLDAVGTDARYWRRFRVLPVPERAMLEYWGVRTASDVTVNLDKGQYAADITGLKESVRYWMRVGNFTTPTQRVERVEPPQLLELQTIEEHPAYLYYLPPTDPRGNPDPSQLVGKKQLIRPINITLTGPSRIVVRAGTKLRLRGQTSKSLSKAQLIPASEEGKPAGPPVPVAIADSQIDFEHDLGQPAADAVYLLEFYDQFGVRSQRLVRLKVEPDRPPEIDVVLDSPRKTQRGLMITARAIIPFADKSEIRDDVGLSELRYKYEYAKFDINTQQEGEKLTDSIPIEDFVEKLARADRLSVKEFAQRLSVPLPTRYESPLLRVYKFPPPADLRDDLIITPRKTTRLDVLDLDYLREKGKLIGLDAHIPNVTRRLDRYYKLRVWIEAVDNNVDTGPSKTTLRDPLTFFVVPEDDLLVEIGKERKLQSDKMKETIDRLERMQDALTGLPSLQSDLATLVNSTLAMPREPDEARKQQLRRQEIEIRKQRVDVDLASAVRAREDTKNIMLEYLRFVREMRRNRIDKAASSTESDIIVPLRKLVSRDDDGVGEFQQFEQSLETILTSLDSPRLITDPISLTPQEKDALVRVGEPAMQKLNDLLNKLRTVYAVMREADDVNAMREWIVRIEKRQQEIGKSIDQQRKDTEEADVEDAEGAEVAVTAEPVKLAKGATAPVTLRLKRDNYTRQAVLELAVVQQNSGLALDAPDLKQSGTRPPDQLSVPVGPMDNTASLTIRAGQTPGTYQIRVRVIRPGNRPIDPGGTITVTVE
jgi:hypothetical protein